jgi:hypothetical protein
MRGGLGFNQLCVDPNLTAGSLDAAFEHRAHAELMAELFRINRFVPIGECGAGRDHKYVS